MTRGQVIAAATMAAFLAALAYVGYVNEQLKGMLSDVNRAVLLIGFIIGAYATARYMLARAERSLVGKGAARKRERNVR